jgi:chromosome segregation ATPase
LQQQQRGLEQELWEANNRLGQLREELQQRDSQQTQLSGELDAQRVAKQATESQLQSLTETNEQLRREADQRSEELSELHARLVDLETSLEQQQQEIEARQQQLDQQENDTLQRAEAAEAQVAALTKQLSLVRSEIQSHGTTLQESNQETQRLREQLDQLQRDNQALKLRLEERPGATGQDDSLLAEIAELRDQNQMLRAECDDLKEAAGQSQIGSETVREDLSQRIQELETLLEQAQDQSSTPESEARLQSDLEEIQKKYRAALDEVHQKSDRITKLEGQLGSGKFNSPIVAAASSLSFDWEAQKQRMLLELESEGDNDDDPRRQQERLKIEQVIKKTDALVREKEQELAGLQQLLEQQSSNVGGMAIGAAAIAEMLDTDEIIVEEREKLRRQQAEWEEKLRTAEIELAMERATIARQSSAIEEKLRTYERQQQDMKNSVADSGTSEKGNETPKKGRWLTRLGLRDQNDS